MDKSTQTETGEGNAPCVEIREGGMPEGFGQFHVYTNGLYNYSCRTRAEAERVISERFQRDELLAACKALLEAHSPYMIRAAAAKARAAIAKAEGSK